METVPVRRSGATGLEDKPALAVDATGGGHDGSVYADPVGRGRVFVKTSPDGSTWPDPSVQVHRRGDGHQWMADVATDGRHLDVVYLHSRDDPAFAPRHPPGETADGRNSGNVVQTWLARSSDGGRTWLEQRLSAAGSNPNWEVQDAGRYSLGITTCLIEGGLDLNVYGARFDP